MLERGIPDGVAHSELRGRRPLAWVTSTEGLDELRQRYSEPSELATAIRDRLGLSHYDQDQLLLEVTIQLRRSPVWSLSHRLFLKAVPASFSERDPATYLWGSRGRSRDLWRWLPEAVQSSDCIHNRAFGSDASGDPNQTRASNFNGSSTAPSIRGPRCQTISVPFWPRTTRMIPHVSSITIHIGLKTMSGCGS